MLNRNFKISKGFTLIELLVVVAIIAVLVAILLPALTNARNQAKNVTCASNMKQLHLGLMYYIQDNKDYFPPSGGPYVHDKSTWVYRLSTKGYIKDNAGPPYGYYQIKPPSVWLCPLDTRVRSGEYFHSLSYGANRFLTGFYSNWQGKKAGEPYKLDQIEEPAKTPFLTDNDMWVGCYPAHIPEDYMLPSYPYFRHYHNNGDFFLFVGGNVGWVQNLDVPGNPSATRYLYIFSPSFVQDPRFWY